MASPSEDAVAEQDAAAERFLPVAVAAIEAAPPAGLPPIPEPIAAAVHLAVLATVIAIIARLIKGAPAEALPPPEPSDVEVKRVADAITPDLADEVWEEALRYSQKIEAGTKSGVTPAQQKAKYAKLLARTLATRAAAEASLASGSELGMGWKIWLTRGDERVRSSHRKLHGRPVEMSKPFLRFPSGQVLDFPGDPRAPLSEIAGCRCFVWVSPTKAGIVEALAPADLDKAFALAASLEAKWS